LKWLEESVGGLEKMATLNRKKAQLLYRLLDNSSFYRATAQPDSRSLMNVTFRMPNEQLEERFIREGLKNGLGGLKGHRSVGGCRASLYNAVSLDAVEVLTDFMATFEKKYG
jgi:phosphoserine aminotransferase